MSRYYISLELGGTSLRKSIVSSNDEMMFFEAVSTDALKNASNKVAYFIDIIESLSLKVGLENVIAVTMALSSLMDKNCEYVYSSPMVDGFDNIPLKHELQKKFPVPVILEKDVNAILLYEIAKNQLEVDGVIVCIMLGTGLGNAMAIDGRIYRGFTGSACELGHIPVPHSSKACNCGKTGCIELYASGKALRDISQELNCDIIDLFNDAVDRRVTEILDYFAIAIASECSILDPRHVIIGGGVLKIPNFPLGLLEEKVRYNLRCPNPRESFKFIRASQDDEAGVMGAVINAKQLGFV